MAPNLNDKQELEVKARNLGAKVFQLRRQRVAPRHTGRARHLDSEHTQQRLAR